MRIGIGLGLTGLRGVPADPFADLYGTGMGQMPMMLDPLDAVLDGSGNVVSIANKGGAGAAFNATTSATGMTRTGNLLSTPGGVWLSLANPADMIGVRLFIVAALDPAAVGTAVKLAGRSAGTATGQRSEVHLSPSNTSLALRRWDGGAFINAASVVLPSATGSTLRLIEVEFAGGSIRSWMDGVGGAAVTAPADWPDLLVDRLLAGYGAPTFSGQAGVVASVITDGTPARDATMLAVRQTLAARYGIALA